MNEIILIYKNPTRLNWRLNPLLIFCLIDHKRDFHNVYHKIIAAPVEGLQKIPKRRKLDIIEKEPVYEEIITKRHVVRFRILDRPEFFIGNGALIAPQRVLTTSSILDPFRAELRGQLLATGIFDGVLVQNIIINENYKSNPYADIGVASVSRFTYISRTYGCLSLILCHIETLKIYSIVVILKLHLFLVGFRIRSEK